jgi:hypothetical protein
MSAKPHPCKPTFTYLIDMFFANTTQQLWIADAFTIDLDRALGHHAHGL